VSKDVRGRVIKNDTPGCGQYNPRIIDRDHMVPELIHETRVAESGDWIDRSKEEIPPPDSYQSVQMMGRRRITISRLARGEFPLLDQEVMMYYMVHFSSGQL
jgi:hypothetical protein